MSERLFPIQSKHIKSIPWAMIAPYERQAIRNHGGQTLDRLAERGGLSPHEALLILRCHPWYGRIFVLPRDRKERDEYAITTAVELQEKANQWLARDDGSSVGA